VLLLALGASGRAEEPDDESVRARVEAHVRYLAGEGLSGRGEWKDRVVAAEHVAKAFEEAGLEKVPGLDAWFVDQGPSEGGEPWQRHDGTARNVMGWLPLGADPAAPEYVIVSAHYDHLPPDVEVADGGTARRVVYPGADDNASGTASLLEVARILGTTDFEEPPPRGVLFVAFDLEEQGLVGSRRFAAAPPMPLERCAAFLTMDQMGRSLADLVPGTLFVMGAEHAVVLRDLLADREPPDGGKLALLGIDFQPRVGYSDYLPFLEREMPFLFLSSGSCGDWHKPEDVPDRIDYDGLAVRTEWVAELVSDLLSRERPVWRHEFEPTVREIEVVRDVVAAAIPKLPEMGLPPAMVTTIENFRKKCDDLIAKGTVTEAERNGIRAMAQMLFLQAVRLR
jgi:hypothetical protein